jgi:hypothetical protein
MMMGARLGNWDCKLGKESKLTIIAHPTSPHLTFLPPSLPSPIVVVVVGPTNYIMKIDELYSYWILGVHHFLLLLISTCGDLPIR